jgi:hypothetical protein
MTTTLIMKRFQLIPGCAWKLYVYIKNKIHEILGLITLKQLILSTLVFVVRN